MIRLLPVTGVLLAAALADVPAVLAGGVMDRLDTCDELAKKNKCLTNQEQMLKDCPLACRKWEEATYRVEYARIGEDDPSFFELSAKNSTGSTLNFDMFDGYLTIVANVLKSCIPGQMEQVFASIEHLHDVWPYALEVLIFPFSTPESDEEVRQFQMSIGCDSYTDAVEKKGRRIHVMEEAKLNGNDAHPVYRYLGKQFKLKLDGGKIPTDVASFFIVTPDGDRIEAHFGSSRTRLKHTLAMHLEQDL
mmetsp:Transcript_2394/g.4978  ORF Transcript_2394/g.4978 Transcript_2394/m.4978 type:complete len:248 (+) Transcript_2394:272-1015(+)